MQRFHLNIRLRYLTYLGYLTYHQQDKSEDLLFMFDNATYELIKIYAKNHNGEVLINHANNVISDNMENKIEIIYGSKGFITETRIYKGSSLQHSVGYENLTYGISKTSFLTAN